MAYITLAKFEQGKEYPAEDHRRDFQQRPRAEGSGRIEDRHRAGAGGFVRPADGTSGASTDAHPTIVFSEPVSNPDLAKTLVTVEPKVEGTFRWAEPNKLEFVPTAPWDHLQDVTMRVKGGPTGTARHQRWLRRSRLVRTFTTAPAKSIDVDVTEQTVTLLENGKVVESFLCSTGAVGTDTPLGDYTIYAKMAVSRHARPGILRPQGPLGDGLQGRLHHARQLLGDCLRPAFQPRLCRPAGRDRQACL